MRASAPVPPSILLRSTPPLPPRRKMEPRRPSNDPPPGSTPCHLIFLPELLPFVSSLSCVLCNISMAARCSSSYGEPLLRLAFLATNRSSDGISLDLDQDLAVDIAAMEPQLRRLPAPRRSALQRLASQPCFPSWMPEQARRCPRTVCHQQN
ncbi:hypothetical protein VPH35_104534 [Triticum aestivum]